MARLQAASYCSTFLFTRSLLMSATWNPPHVRSKSFYLCRDPSSFLPQSVYQPTPSCLHSNSNARHVQAISTPNLSRSASLLFLAFSVITHIHRTTTLLLTVCECSLKPALHFHYVLNIYCTTEHFDYLSLFCSK